MEDLFKTAGIDPTEAPSLSTTRGGEKRKQRHQGERERDATEVFGGHNLRQVIRSREPFEETLVARPRTALASAKATDLLQHATAETASAHHQKQPLDDYEDDDYAEGDDDDGDDDLDLSDDDNDDADSKQDTDSKLSARAYQKPPTPPATPTPASASTNAAASQAGIATTNAAASQAGTATSIPLTSVKPDSRLGRAAAEVFATSGFSLLRELGWQSAVAGDTAKCKAFRVDVTQQVDVTPFGFMRPSSPFIQILHSISTYAVRGGVSDLHNVDFGFAGDRTSLRIPTPVVVDEKMWKWVSKTMGLDVPPLEEYYAKAGNDKLLYHDDASGGEVTSVPRMIYLPPPFLVYCLEEQRTPFQLHQFVGRYAARPGAEVDSTACELITDWCFMASHRGAKTTPTTSMLAISLPAAPSDDDDFLRWLYKIDCTGGATAAAAPRAAPILSTPHQPPAGRAVAFAPTTAPTPTGPPPPDVWTQMAQSISTSFATAAAAMKPPPSDPTDTEYERGGVNYDKFQLAIIKGFAHTADITGVPVIWALFQYTKNLETHKDNLRRKMVAWATSPNRPIQVQIERGLYIPDSTMKEILSLTFNPGGILAEAEAADLGLSLLICRARSRAAKAAIRKYERALEQSKRNRSMAEAQAERAPHAAYEPGALPDDYHELLRCIGTYCAMLHALFGDRCVFYRHCYELWSTMNGDLVYEQRADFTALYCRQIVWAVLLESRVYFSKRMSIDDFTNVHPDDIVFPTSKLLTVVQAVEDMSPIVRSSFPAAWNPDSTVTRGPTSGPSASVNGRSSAPMQSVTAAGGTTPSVVSGITTGSTRPPRPPVTIRTTDVHPQIKATMEAYIAKNKGVWLSTILNHVNLTMEDLPRPAPEVCGTSSICYNYILGRCHMDPCNHKHLRAQDLTDDFASELLTKLRPGITEFTANGVPPAARRRRRQQHRRTNNE
jgi:hypothetical protein